MSYYDKIYEYAADNLGLITTTNAKALGIPIVELAKLSHRGRLVRLGHGVYRIIHYIPTPLDKYAEAVAMVGANAYIFGESVLAMHGLAFVNPIFITVATSDRIRKTLPKFIKVINRKNEDQITDYEGIPSQSVLSAILSCRKSIMSDRLENSVDEARDQGLITQNEAEFARRELRDATKQSLGQTN